MKPVFSEIRGGLERLGASALAASSTSPGNGSIAGARNAVICGRGLKNELYILQHEEEASTNVIHGTSAAAAAASTSTVTAKAAHMIIENHLSGGNTKETAINGDLKDSWLQTSPMKATIELLSMNLELLQAENHELCISQHEEEASTKVIHGTSAAATASTSNVTAMAAHMIIENHPSEGNTKETAIINEDLKASWLQTMPIEAKIEFLSMKLELLQAENHQIKALAWESLGAKRELQSARLKIKHLKRKLRSSRARAREKEESLHSKIAQLANENEEIVTEVRRKMKELEDLQDAGEELKKANMMMKQENMDLEQRMQSAKMLFSVLEDPQSEALEEIKHLRESNAKLQKKIVKLEAHQKEEAEELRHLRWLNTKLSNYLSSEDPSPGMTKTGNKDRQKRVSPILDDFSHRQQQEQHRYNNSPQGSVPEFSDSRRSATIDSASPKKSIDDWRKLKILCKFKKLVSRKNSKDNSSSKLPPLESERRCMGGGGADDKTSGSFSTCSDDGSSAASSCMTTEDRWMASPKAGSGSDASERWSSSSAWINGAFHSPLCGPAS